MIRFGLVSFPAEAFNAHLVERDHPSFHQLHAKCHSRIRYQKTCPIHGPVDNDEIVNGFETSKGRFVEIEPEELEAARSQKEKSITIDTFIDPEQVDPFFYDGRVYVLAPAGDAGREPYAVFLEALQSKNRYGIGTVVFSGKDQVVLVRPYEDVLLMVLLNYSAEMRAPAAMVKDLPVIRHTDKSVRLAEQLIESWTDDRFDFAAYKDTYTEKVQEIIDAKVQGRETVAPTEEEEPDVINLADALRKSLGEVAGRGRSRSSSRRKPRKKKAS